MVRVVLMRDAGVSTGACACHFQVPGAGGDFDARSARRVDLSRVWVWVRSRGPVGFYHLCIDADPAAD